MTERDITLSVVSHGQNALVNELLEDVQRACAPRVHLVLTENIPDPVPLRTEHVAAPVKQISNEAVKGFGSNHNAAFRSCTTPWFCVSNPDIRLLSDPFPPLLEALADPAAGVAGPLVRSPAGQVEDSARLFPTAWSLAKKIVAERRTSDYPTDRGPQPVDWVAGMFMLFRSDAFRAIGGFDEDYFLYYEDVDICHRLRSNGKVVVFEPRAEVIHDARRASRLNPRLALHHIVSMARFLASR